jgi:hypothetical protein
VYNETTEKIDRLLHDAQNADAGRNFASMMGNYGPANELRDKCESLKAEAIRLYLANPDADWPHPDDCEWIAPQRTGQ